MATERVAPRVALSLRRIPRRSNQVNVLSRRTCCPGQRCFLLSGISLMRRLSCVGFDAPVKLQTHLRCRRRRRRRCLAQYTLDECCAHRGTHWSAQCQHYFLHWIFKLALSAPALTRRSIKLWAVFEVSQVKRKPGKICSTQLIAPARFVHKSEARVKMADDESFSTREVFNSAVCIVKNLPKEGAVKPSDELKLKLYAYYKQATYGPNDTPKPRFYQIVEGYKWDAWKKLAAMSKEDAMLNYIRELKQIMESLPADKVGLPNDKCYEEVLGKKFYDYWFRQWKKSGALSKNHLTGDISHETFHKASEQTVRSSNDTHSSNSSEDSSVSLLEETQSLAEGYKTPTSSVYKDNNSVMECSDQFAAALLRLQHDLQEANLKLSRFESSFKHSLDRIAKLEEQTGQKPLVWRPAGSSLCSVRGFWGLLKGVKAAHWFYLSYPMLVFVVMRLIEQRRKRKQHLLNAR